MGDLVYPDEPRPIWPWGSNQGFETNIIKKGPGEQRRSKQRFPRYDFNLRYDLLTKVELQILFDFYRKHFGAGETFWYYEHLGDLYAPMTYYNQLVGYSDGVIDTFDIPGRLLGDSTKADIIMEHDFQTGIYDLPTGISFLGASSSHVLGDRWRVTFDNDGIADHQIMVEDPSIIGLTPASTHKARWKVQYAGGYEHSLISYAQAYDGTTSYSAYNANWNFVYSLGQPIQFDVLMTEVAGTGDYLALGNLTLITFDSWVTINAPASTYDIFYLGFANDWGDFLEVYLNDVKQTRDTDYEVLYGGGSGNSDRIRFISSPPALGNLITCDFTGRLRVKSRFEVDDMSFDWFASTLFESGLDLRGVLPNIT